MATIVESAKGLVHDTAGALVENQIPTKIGAVIAGMATSSFEIVTDVLKVVQKVTEPESAEEEPPSP
jgi:hypothetical protein